jgi:hypothetical protein
LLEGVHRADAGADADAALHALVLVHCGMVFKAYGPHGAVGNAGTTGGTEIRVNAHVIYLLTLTY